MSSEPLISVIVPVYNAEKYLGQCMESIVAQSYTRLEILVVDDGSTDGSGAMCDRWAERDKRIRVFHQPNGGHSAARNTALDNMSGELVMMVDSDDVLHREFADRLVKLMLDHDADIAVGGYLPFYGDEAGLPALTHKAGTREYDQHEAILAVFYQQGLTHSPWGRVFKASLFDDIRFPVGFIYEDLAIIYPLLKKCHRIVTTSDILYGYRQHDSNSMRVFGEHRADVLQVCEQLEGQMLNDDSQYVQAVRSRLLSAYFNILLLRRPGRSVTLESLGVGLRHQCFLKLPR